MVERPESGKGGACPLTNRVLRSGVARLYTPKRGSNRKLLLTRTTSSTRSVTLDIGEKKTAEQIVSAQKSQLELKKDQRIRERFLGALQVSLCPRVFEADQDFC